MNFSQVAHLFENIQATSSRLQTTDMLAVSLQQMSPEEAQMHVES